MPQNVIRDGVMCYEYSPQELDAIRLEKIIDYQVKHGAGKQQVSSIVDTGYGLFRMTSRGRELRDTNNFDSN